MAKEEKNSRQYFKYCLWKNLYWCYSDCPDRLS